MSFDIEFDVVLILAVFVVVMALIVGVWSEDVFQSDLEECLEGCTTGSTSDGEIVIECKMTCSDNYEWRCSDGIG